MAYLTPVAANRTADLSYEDLTPPASPSFGNGGAPLSPRISKSSSGSASTANAPRSLALKISRLLSASLEDAGTRTALETLDEFGLVDTVAYGPGAGGRGAVGASGDARTAKSKQLRAEIDKRLLDDSQRFLNAFKEVNDVRLSMRVARTFN